MNPRDEMAQARQTFIDESRELLQGMEAILLRAEGGRCDAEDINALFRGAHTIKGSAGLFGLDPIVAFTHGLENVLDRVRSGDFALTPDLVALLVECADHLGRLIEEVAAASRAPGEATCKSGAALLERLAPWGSRPAPTPGPDTPASVGDVGTWHLSLRFGRDVFRNGMDPLSFVAYLGELGELVQVVTVPDALPAAADMDPESCYLGFEIALRSDRTRQAIEEAFDFVRDDCSLHIVAPGAGTDLYEQLLAALPEGRERGRELLAQCGRIEPAPAAPPATTAMPAAAPAPQDPGPERRQGEERRRQDTRFLKVAADRLDALIDLVGELVIAGATTAAVAQREGHPAMLEATATLGRLVEEIRDSALRMRMVPIGETFARFPRVVRDVSRELGKDIRLTISGGDTELDKAMVERLGDPLTHLVRNAIDHGIESGEARLAAGKPACGELTLHAYPDSGSIVVEVRDDGGGIDRARVRAKAIERGVIAPDAVLADQDLLQLIFEPGFSTAAAVTNLSGRGVGMDVVKRNVEALRGSIEVDSREGMGTTIRMRLPLTLAIIDGFLCAVGPAHYIVPLDMVVECIGMPDAPGEASTAGYLDLRGEALPYLDVGRVFGADAHGAARRSLIVVRHGEGKAGLVVDRLLGEYQTVIKPLGTLFRHLRGIAGSTILGTGEVALILDVSALIQREMQHQSVPLRPEDGAVAARNIPVCPLSFEE